MSEKDFLAKQDKYRTAFDLALGVEVSAARIEAALALDPEIATQWRSEIGVAEAVASVGLEDVRISETDLLVRVSENTGEGIEARAVEDALAILRFIKSPGDAAARPDEVFDRIDRLAMRGGESEGAVPGQELAPLFDHCRGRSPILEAVRVASGYAWATNRRSPVAERMVFMAAEHTSRGSRPAAPLRDTDLRGLGGTVRAGWICPPSVALSRGHFRIWSPSSPDMVRDLMEGIDKVLSQEIGRIISIRRWQDKATELGNGRHGRSRLSDAARAFGLEPFMTSRILADRIGVTQRGALNILKDMVENGILVELTRRRAARIWATPGLASMLMAGKVRSSMAVRSMSTEKENVSGLKNAPQCSGTQFAAGSLKDRSKLSIERAMSEFENVLDQVDEILAKHPSSNHR